MSLFRMRKTAATSLEGIQRDFLWGGSAGKRKPHSVGWEKCCWKKEEGCLGLKKLTVFNPSLLQTRAGEWPMKMAHLRNLLLAASIVWKRGIGEHLNQQEPMGC